MVIKWVDLGHYRAAGLGVYKSYEYHNIYCSSNLVTWNKAQWVVKWLMS